MNHHNPMLLPDVAWRPAEKYRFLLLADFTLTLPEPWHGDRKFIEGGKCWGRMVDSQLTIFAGFAHDGCSPSQIGGIKYLSIPSPASTIVGSMYHDFFYQYIGVPGCPWDRSCADGELRRLLRMNAFPAAQLYYGAVRLCGGAFLAKKQSTARGPSILTCI